MEPTSLGLTPPRPPILLAPPDRIRRERNMRNPLQRKAQPAMRPMERNARAVAPAISSMDLPNRAGQTGPVPMKGIVNSLMQGRK